jgi:hypothetical protein
METVMVMATETVMVVMEMVETVEEMVALVVMAVVETVAVEMVVDLYKSAYSDKNDYKIAC